MHSYSDAPSQTFKGKKKNHENFSNLKTNCRNLIRYFTSENLCLVYVPPHICRDMRGPRSKIAPQVTVGRGLWKVVHPNGRILQVKRSPCIESCPDFIADFSLLWGCVHALPLIVFRSVLTGLDLLYRRSVSCVQRTFVVQFLSSMHHVLGVTTMQ